MNDRTGGWILAIDLGNSGPKAAAVALDATIVTTAARRVSVDIGADGTATQDAEEWIRALTEAVAEVVQSGAVQPSRLHAVAVTGQWGSSVPVGADGRPAGPVLLWADTRAAGLVQPIVSGRVQISGYAPHKVLPWLRLTGGAPTPTGADPTGHDQLLQHELVEVGRRTTMMLEPVDYLVFRLTGRAVATPASMTLSWLTDNRIGSVARYRADLVRRARRTKDWLPELVPTGTVAGPLLAEIAQEFALPAGVPVVTGIPDFHAGILGSGAVEPYRTHLALSTTAWLSTRVPFKRTDIRHSIATVPGLDPYLPAVINNIETGGAALQWLREQVIAPPDGLVGGGSGIGADGAADPLAAPTFEALMDLAASAPAGSEGVLFAPWLAGERSPVEDKRLRATWLNLSLRTNRSALVRSVLEGVAFNIRWLFDAYLKFLGTPVESVRLIGGGAQADLWAQIIAGVLDRPVERVADPMHAQLRGVAMWARVCLGEITLRQAGLSAPVDREFHPGDTDRDEYQRLYGHYRRVYPAVRGLYHGLNR